MSTYRLIMERDDNGTWLVTCPAIPEVTTFAEDKHGAVFHSRGAIEEAIAARMAAGEPIPSDDVSIPADAIVVRATLPAMTDLKAQLYTACRDAGVTRADLVRRLGWHRNSVDRLFDLNHQSRLDQLEAAAFVLGFRLETHLVAPAA